VVFLSVGLSVTIVSPAKTAEPIEMPFGVWSVDSGGPRKNGGAHWRHLASTIEPSIPGGDVASLSND